MENKAKEWEAKAAAGDVPHNYSVPHSQVLQPPILYYEKALLGSGRQGPYCMPRNRSGRSPFYGLLYAATYDAAP